MEPWRVCKPVFVDSNHSEEEQDPDSHLSEMLDPDPLQSYADPQLWSPHTANTSLTSASDPAKSIPGIE
jgi:hypothetical protein